MADPMVLGSGWAVDQAIVREEEKVVVMRFGRPAHPDCTRMDAVLYKAAQRLRLYVSIYFVDLDAVPDFNDMYELHDTQVATMFFFRNRHIQVDVGTGNNNKIDWAMDSTQDFVDIAEVVYRGGRKGKGLVVAPSVDYARRRS